MDLLKGIIVCVGFLVVLSLVTNYLSKKYHIEKQTGKYIYATAWHRQLEKMFYIVFMIVIMIEIFLLNHYVPFGIYGIILSIFGTRAYVEYRYRKDQKQYLLHIANLVSMLIFFTAILLFTK